MPSGLESLGDHRVGASGLCLARLGECRDGREPRDPGLPESPYHGGGIETHDGRHDRRGEVDECLALRVEVRRRAVTG